MQLSALLVSAILPLLLSLAPVSTMKDALISDCPEHRGSRPVAVSKAREKATKPVRKARRYILM
jgi:hypothetical protein